MAELKKQDIFEIEKKNWDILIILDACRYDNFKTVYNDFFSGYDLKNKISPTTDTQLWVNSMFLNKHCSDIIYITPIVCIDVWLPKHSLFLIVKSWKKNWNSEYGIVMPDGTNKAFYDTIKSHPEKRYVIHYGQPHTPYINIVPDIPRTINDTLTRIKSSIIKNVLFDVWSKIQFPDTWLWYINQFLMIKSKKSNNGYTYFDQVYNLGGWEGIRNAYINNLRYVLSYVKAIVDKYPDKNFVITADHGEYLGEDEKFGHKGKKGKVINEVPWLEIKRK